MKLDINKMVSNFLSWKLPNDFSPNGFIEFKDANIKSNSALWPTGINLLYAGQAKEMIEHMLEGVELGSVDAEPVAVFETYTGNGGFCAPYNRFKFKDGYIAQLGDKLFTAPPQLANQAATILQLQIEANMLRDLLNVSQCPECDGSGVIQYSENDIQQCQWCYEKQDILSTQPSTTLAEHDKPDEYDMVLLTTDGMHISLDIANLTITKSGVKQFTLVDRGGK